MPHIHRLTNAEFQALTDQQLSDLFSDDTIIVVEGYQPGGKFDLEGLILIGDFTAECDVHGKQPPFPANVSNTLQTDQSLPVVDHDFQTRVRSGTLEQLYAISQDPTGKPVNALYFPQSHARYPTLPIAADARAVARTFANPHCINELPYKDVQFGLAATMGAISFWHIDPEGECTYVVQKAGVKVWYFAIEKNKAQFRSIRWWTKHEKDVRQLDYTQYDVVSLALKAGDLAYVLPYIMKILHPHNDLHSASSRPA